MNTRKVVAAESFLASKGTTENKIESLSLGQFQTLPWLIEKLWDWDWPHKTVQTGKDLATLRSQQSFLKVKKQVEMGELSSECLNFGW